MSREHRNNLDIIRCIATLLILIYHYNCTLLEFGETNIWRFGYAWGSYSVGAIGVVLFFMLSGTALIYNYGANAVFDCKKFLLKRLSKMFLLYWALYIIVYIVYAVRYHNVLFNGGSPVTILFSFFQLDFFDDIIYQKWGGVYWLVGEWFSTVIIFIYIVFPFLRHLYIKYWKTTTLILFFLFWCNNYLQILTFGNGYFSITNGVFAFWLGMIFLKVKYSSKIKLTAFILLIALLIFNPSNFFNIEYFPVFLFSLCLYVFLYGFDYQSNLVKSISNISYEVYLLHHRIQILIIPYLIAECEYISQKILLFVFVTVSIFIASKYAHLLNKFLAQKCLKK